MKLIKLQPVLVSKIWGGNVLKEKYSFDTPLTNIGELWAISAIDGNTNNLEEINISFKDYYENNTSLFNIDDKVFPLLVKILDAKDDLSIQVHPDNNYALTKHNSLGKNECWYIMDLEKNDEIIYGCQLHNKDELINAIKRDDFAGIIRVIKIKKHDFLDVPVGMIHAIKSGTMLYELQQSSDITYRLYDYHRLENGKERELHLEDSINVVKYDNLEPNDTVRIINDNHQRMINNKFFVLDKIKTGDNIYKTSFKMPFLLITCLNGSGFINKTPLKGGESIIVVDYNSDELVFTNNMEIMIASSKLLD